METVAGKNTSRLLRVPPFEMVLFKSRHGPDDVSEKPKLAVACRHQDAKLSHDRTFIKVQNNRSSPTFSRFSTCLVSVSPSGRDWGPENSSTLLSQNQVVNYPSKLIGKVATQCSRCGVVATPPL